MVEGLTAMEKSNDAGGAEPHAISTATSLEPVMLKDKILVSESYVKLGVDPATVIVVG